jgi:hypothetical protein
MTVRHVAGARRDGRVLVVDDASADQGRRPSPGSVSPAQPVLEKVGMSR